MHDRLTGLQLYAIELLVMGRTEKEIAEIVEKSASYVTKLKKHPDFDKAYEDSLNKVRETVQTVGAEMYVCGLQESQKRTEEIAKNLYLASKKLFEKLSIAINDVEPEELRGRNLAPMLKIISEVAQASLLVEDRALGLERLIENFQKIEKLGGFDMGLGGAGRDDNEDTSL